METFLFVGLQWQVLLACHDKEPRHYKTKPFCCLLHCLRTVYLQIEPVSCCGDCGISARPWAASYVVHCTYIMLR